MKGRPWYKRYAADFVHGVVGLGPDVIGAYAVVLDLIYDHGGPVRNDARWLAGILGCSSRKATSLISKLIEVGKLVASEGMLSNIRAAKEIETASNSSRKLSESGANGGRKRAENESDARKNNDLGQALPKHRARLEARVRGREERPLSETAVPDPPPIRMKKPSNYPAKFEEFWKGYPTDSLMSKKQAGDAWAKIQEEAQIAIIASLPAFRSYCQAHVDYRPVHAIRYITQERYVGFNETAAKIIGKVFVPAGTDAWKAWQAVRKTSSVHSMEHRQDGWWFPSEWPGREAA